MYRTKVGNAVSRTTSRHRVVPLSFPRTISLQFVTDGEANGVVGKKGVPVAESSPGVSDGGAVSSDVGAAIEPGMNVWYALYAIHIHRTIQKMGIDNNRMIGIQHGIISKHSRDTTEFSMAYLRVSNIRYRQKPLLLSDGNCWFREKWLRARSFSAHCLSSQEASCKTSSMLYFLIRK
mmetsp:Transcript_24287/g.34747  ORF Transcript_24287/g.34747 Transcript_24287/m.34747 type:complete len:178 (-) Transcript_24287:121-654(-)